ncbi:charged multivesicular body protein 2a 2 [Colletotrichum spaethianum]|uniref:Charged multivesicular body protein 2a 2 n=1 Tax=Colletotrichum spaethianum TaxID=700344 RepID=A0AA37UR12_9PEZI|nr:charged multivesicular body protein 2a 2 [Colletotrichum spaethianum]GKT49862.1 charged multivesicular body protein 2a 2 [Colletotrichum spaethianum]
MNILEYMFGKRMTPAERLRKNQRMLDKAIRELDQVRVKLEKQEKQLITQIKQSAQKGQMGACKIQAKDLVRTRRYIEKFYGMRSQLQKISLRLQTYRTNEQMMTAMKGATQALGTMNRSMNLPALQRIAMEFERENDIMDQRQEMMDDVMDDAMDVGAEEEGEEVVEQVLEEIGVDLTSAVSTYDQLMIVKHWLTRWFRSSEKHRLECKRQQYRRAELLKRSAEVGARILATTTFKPVSTASDGSRSNTEWSGRKAQ